MAAMNFDLPNGFGTVSSALVAVAASPGFRSQTMWLHAEGAPDRSRFQGVDLYF
jgi:hypothetical protein